jgi:hypothetical protein
MQTQEIQPIINGSANPRLTPELFNQLDNSTKRRVIWNILVSMEFAHTYKEVDHEVFEKPTFKVDYQDLMNEEEGTALDLDALFVTVKKESEAHENRMMVKTANRRFELGKKIHAAQKELGFGGWIELDKDRMQGYIKAGGSWNDFDASKVSGAIGKLHELAPRMNYGPNNPNTGNLIHKWKSVHRTEYLVMEYEFIGPETLEEVKEFYKTHWEPIGKSVKADSIRYEVVEHGNNYFGIELIMWWD